MRGSDSKAKGGESKAKGGARQGGFVLR